MFKGVFFLLRYFWKHDKRYIFYQLFRQLLISLVPLADTIIPKYIIDELMGEQCVRIIVWWISVLLLINLLGNWLIKYIQEKLFLIQGHVFTEFQTMMARKLSQSDFSRLEDPEFLDIQEKARKLLYGNGQGFGSVDDFQSQKFLEVLAN